MAIGGGGSELPPLDIDRLSKNAPALSGRTRTVLYVVIGVMSIFVVAGLVWIFLPD
jgi:hypothetical protein